MLLYVLGVIFFLLGLHRLAAGLLRWLDSCWSGSRVPKDVS